MKHAVPLHEFMPYGAPDLIESRQRHMGQALVLTCAAFLLLSAVLGALVPMLATERAVPRLPSVEILTNVNLPQMEKIPAPPPLLPPAPQIHRVPDQAIPVPAPDVAEVPVAPSAPSPPSATTGPAGRAGPADTGPAAATGDVLPSPNAPVYVEELPSVVKEVKPIYPSMAREAGIEGLVMVKALVGKDGRVLDVMLMEKYQVPVLNESALEAARQWVFTPGLDNGRPVACWTVIPFRFRLH